MGAELYRYAELLVFLAGTLLYGFLGRELLRRPRVLPGNRPLRLLLLCLTVWYGGALADELLGMLAGPVEPGSGALPFFLALDVVRAVAWLLTLPLAVHTLLRVPAAATLPLRPWQRRLLIVAPYLPLLLFATPALRFLQTAEPFLAVATRQVAGRIALHAVIALPLAALFALALARRVDDHATDRAAAPAADPFDDHRLAPFLRRLAAVLAALLLLLVAGALADPWAADAGGWERLLRSLLLAGLLLPGALLAYHVQRYNLLRLSLSHRTLRHFAAVIAVASAIMLLGPALEIEDRERFRRFLAAGLILVLAAGLLYRRVADALLERSPLLRRLSGRLLAPRELERVMAAVESPATDEDALLARAAGALGEWLGGRASFLPTDDGELASLWRYFRDRDAAAIHRLAPPSAELAALLGRRRLHAVFALRVAGELEGLLGLEASVTGGAYDRGERETVQLVMRQLAGTLALRRLLARRLAEERELADEERLSTLGLVAASLAHELKNPLSSIQALAQNLRQELARDGAHAEGVADLDVIVEQIARLDQVAREILGLARPSRAARVDLAALVESAGLVLAAEARRRGVTLDLGGVGDVGEVPGSAASWQTVVFNLALNAVERTPAGATAVLRLDRDGGRVVLETENPTAPAGDDGVERLFEPFASDGGTGLGLALVARRARELGGEVEARRDGDRIRFRVAVPAEAGGEIATSAAAVHPRPPFPRSSAGPGGRTR